IFREDNIGLYGFSNREERELFLILIKVSGVGPRSAIQILSGIRPAELIKAMQNEDWKRLTLISGIGPKTAKRLLIELKEVLTSQELRFSPSGGKPTEPVLSQAFSALQSLGFDNEGIRAVLRNVSPDEDLETIIRQALGKLSS
ncbi:MAG: Holliday junction branch migration protein RuvA, partial [bacterium]